KGRTEHQRVCGPEQPSQIDLLAEQVQRTVARCSVNSVDTTHCPWHGKKEGTTGHMSECEEWVMRPNHLRAEAATLEVVCWEFSLSKMRVKHQVNPYAGNVRVRGRGILLGPQQLTR